MAKKDMHTYVSRLKDNELETLIATYDIPLDLRPRLPDPNFRMINLSAEDTAIGIYSRIFDSSGVRIPFSSFLLAVLKYLKVHISQLVPLDTIQTGDWFSFAKRGDPAPVCMEVAKSGLKLWKEKFLLIDRRAIPFHMPWRHPDSCITYKVPTSFNQDHVDQIKVHIVKLRDIPEGVLVQSGLSRVWCNPMCDPVLRRSDNTVMSIYDFLCMPSLDKAMVREEPHGLDTSILGKVADHITLPAPAGNVIPRASPKEISVTRPDRKVVTKADHAAKRKASTRPEISTNAAKKTRSSKKGSRAGSSGQAAGDEVEQTDDGTLDDDDQRDGSEFAMEDIGNLNDVSQCVSEDASSPAQEPMPAPDTEPLDADASADEIASDGNVDPYYEARVSNTAGNVLERDLLPFVPGPYYIPYPYDKGYRTELEVLKSRCQMTEHKLSSWDKKHRKCRNERDTLAMEKKKIEEELSDFTALVRRFLKSGEFNQKFLGVLNTAISVGVNLGLCMDHTDEEFRGLSQRVADFIPDAKEKFDRVVVAFPDTTFLFLGMVSQNSHSSLQVITQLEPDRVTSSYQTSSATASLSSNILFHLLLLHHLGLLVILAL
ncbi:hypothetical protein Tco_1010067 [Tanacetum coccineum]